MKKILLLLFAILSITNIQAQTQEIDSLKQALQNEKTDTGRVLLLADLGLAYLESNPDTTMQVSLDGLTLSQRIGFKKGEAFSLNRIGTVYNVLGNYTKAIEIYFQALKINEKINNIEGQHKNFNNIGLIYFAQGDYQKALDYYFKAKPLAEIRNDKKSISILLSNIGEAYNNLKVFDSAILYTQQALNISKQINYVRIIGNSLRILGEIHSGTGENKLALEYFQLGVPLLKSVRNDLSLSQTYCGLAKVFEKTHQNDSALFYSKQSLIIAREKGFTLQLRDAARFLTAFYRNRHMPDSALFFVDISRAANDSLFSQQKQKQFQSLAFDEKLRQNEITATELKVEEERKRNLQYAAIALGLITFVILFLLLSHSIVANQKLIRFFGVVALLMVFEFINLYIHPYLSHATNDSPLLMLLVMVGIASMLVPVHHWMENWITHQLVEKNKKIRLAAAKKTIATLEGEQTN